MNEVLFDSKFNVDVSFGGLVIYIHATTERLVPTYVCDAKIIFIITL